MDLGGLDLGGLGLDLDLGGAARGHGTLEVARGAGDLFSVDPRGP